MVPCVACPGGAGTVADLLAAAKPTVWRGRGEILQIPWSLPFSGPTLLVELWAGVGGLSLALLALGARLYVLSAECAEVPRATLAQNFPSAVLVNDTSQLIAQDLRPFLARRKPSTIVIGGGSPCQGNSSLNTNRQGLGDPRSHQPVVLAEYVAAVAALPEVVSNGIAVVCFLENVKCDDETVAYYNDLMGCEPVEVNAHDFGYVDRRRYLWGRGPKGAVASLPDLRLPQGASLVRSSSPARLLWSSPSPIPTRMVSDDGFALAFDPKVVCRSGGKGAMGTFTREFKHPTDHVSRCSAQAVQRFNEDGRRFPPFAYESGSLMWRGRDWRVPSPSERAQMMGLPARICDPADPLFQEPNLRVAAKNCCVGNGFHLPSVALFLFCLLQTVNTTAALTQLGAAADEARLRARVENTVFQPGLPESFPGILDARDLTKELREQLGSTVKGGAPWALVESNLARCNLAQLQLYWVDACLRGRSDLGFGPEWRSQRDRGMLMASMGQQRAPGNSRRGLDHLLPPGLGMSGHLSRALQLPAPFSVPISSDDDLRFAARTMATWGPAIVGWRRQQAAHVRALASALRPLDDFIVANLESGVARVAVSKRPAAIAAWTALHRWPDRQQARSFVSGFEIVGAFEPTGIFRPKARAELGDVEESFFGHAASELVDTIVRSPPPRNAQEIFEMSALERDTKGFAGPLMDRAHWDKVYGPGGWRPLSRFLHQPESGKPRLIDNAKRTQHNEWTALFETIYCICVDFVPEAIALVFAEVLWMWAGLGVDVTREEALRLLPDWCDPALGLDDLPDAFRGNPVAPAARRASIVAIFNTELGRWQFSEQFGMAYGLASAVVNFNRLPTLTTAVSRRVAGILAGAYFDDIATVDLLCARGSGQALSRLILRTVGAEPSVEKGMPMGQSRNYLGVAVHMGRASSEGTVDLEPREATRLTVMSMVKTAVDKGTMGESDAAKLRGKAQWSGTHSFGKCGHLGIAVCATKQYRSPGALSGEESMALTLLAEVHRVLPPRPVQVAGRPRRPVILYTDASYEESSGRPPDLGWVAVDTEAPDVLYGQSLAMSWETVNGWCRRKQQIYAAETFAVIAAVSNLQFLVAGRDILIFVDNEAAASTLIRGASKEEDVQNLAHQFHWQLLHLGSRAWIEWIDTGSNPADGWSRKPTRMSGS